jgi:phosphoenolpyruvate carboxylase
VTLVSAAIRPATGRCSSDTGVGAFGATVTVVCATGAVTGLEATGTNMPWRPIHGGACRFLTHISKDQLSGTIDSYAGVGTSTAFRVVGLPGREYVEMTVGW